MIFQSRRNSSWVPKILKCTQRWLLSTPFVYNPLTPYEWPFGPNPSPQQCMRWVGLGSHSSCHRFWSPIWKWDEVAISAQSWNGGNTKRSPYATSRKSLILNTCLGMIFWKISMKQEELVAWHAIQSKALCLLWFWRFAQMPQSSCESPHSPYG